MMGEGKCQRGMGKHGAGAQGIRRRRKPHHNPARVLLSADSSRERDLKEQGKCDLIFGMGENQAHPDISDFSSRKNQAHPDISDFCRAQHPDLRMHPDETPSEHPH